MLFVFAVVGAVLGAMVAAGDLVLLGAALGAFAGVVLGRLSRMHARLLELERWRARHAAAAAAPSVEVRPAADIGDRVPAAPDAAPPATAPVSPSRPIPPPMPVGTPPSPAAPASDAADRERIAATARVREAQRRSAAAAAAAEAADGDARTPPPIDRVAGAIRRWFTEGNVPVKVGMLVLFVGVAALLKYAVDQGFVALPIELRLAAVAGAAMAALVFGWRQRSARRVFALSLQGGAIGVLLLTVFAAYRLYSLLPAGAAFALVVVLVAGSALLAILEHALGLAVLGFVGGYLAPVLISTGSGNHVALFSYYALLNAAVFAVAWVRPWRLLNLVGFGFTFGIGLAWGAQYYRPEHFATVEPFLILFFLFYVGIAVAYALRQPLAKRGLVDGTLTFGAPLLAFPLQAAMVEDPMQLAFSALAVAALYLAIFRWLWHRAGLRVLAESFAGLAIGFATLAVPLALSAQWTATTWALEGAALVWLGLRQGRLLPQLAGLLLQLFAACAFLLSVALHGWHGDPEGLPVLNGRALSAALVAIGAFASAWLYDRMRPVPLLAGLLVGWGAAWWLLAAAHDIDVFVGGDARANAWVGVIAGSLLLAVALRAALAWPRLGWVALGGFALAVPLAFAGNAANDAVLEQGGWLFWLGWALSAFVALRMLRQPAQRGLSIAHVLFLLLLPLLAAMQLEDLALRHWALAEGWSDALIVLPLLALVAGTWFAPALAAQPLAGEFPRYHWRWHAPALLLLGAWTLLTLFRTGDPAPLVFVPLLNPLELTQLAVLLLVWRMLRDLGDAWRGIIALGVFAVVTAMTLRGVHHLAGVPWSDALFDSMVAQTALTVAWSVIGVGAWIVGSKRGSRAVWLAGAILMGVVLAKLVLIDREHTGNIPGIVSFIAVGLLLTVVGYFAPSPPRARITEQHA